MTDIIISGANGKMGRMLLSAIAETDGINAVAGLDVGPGGSGSFPVYTSFGEVAERADVIIDFSRPSALLSLLQYAEEKQLGLVLATTGYTDEDSAIINDFAKRVAVFRSANMSLGVNLQISLAARAAKILDGGFDIEIIEKHHNMKVDSPSGTALSIAETINSALGHSNEFVYGRHSKTDKRGNNEIGIHAVRGGTTVGEHDVLFFGPGEVLEINHRASSRMVFAQGALKAARFIHGKPAGLYSMNDIFAEIFDV